MNDKTISVLVATLVERLSTCLHMATLAREGTQQGGNDDATIGALAGIEEPLAEAQALYQAAVAVHRGLVPARAQHG
jgi:hypothetical protein